MNHRTNILHCLMIFLLQLASTSRQKTETVQEINEVKKKKRKKEKGLEIIIFLPRACLFKFKGIVSTLIISPFCILQSLNSKISLNEVLGQTPERKQSYCQANRK